MTDCQHCGDPLACEPVCSRIEHPGYCCDCYDLSWGMPLAQLNEERKKAGKKPAPPWKAKP